MSWFNRVSEHPSPSTESDAGVAEFISLNSLPIVGDHDLANRIRTAAPAFKGRDIGWPTPTPLSTPAKIALARDLLYAICGGRANINNTGPCASIDITSNGLVDLRTLPLFNISARNYVVVTLDPGPARLAEIMVYRDPRLRPIELDQWKDHPLFKIPLEVPVDGPAYRRAIATVLKARGIAEDDIWHTFYLLERDLERT